MIKISIDKKNLSIIDKKNILDISDDLNSFNLYKQRFVNISKSIIETLEYIFNTESNEHNILFLYLTIKYHYSENEEEINNPEALKEEKENFYKTIIEFINFPEFSNLVNKYVNDNYKIKETESENVKKSNDQLLLTKEHCEDLQKISFCMKFFIPLISDYFSLRKLNDNSYFDIFYLIIQQFNEHNISNKLYKFVSSRVENTSYSDAVIWAYLSSTSKDTKNSTLDIFNKIIVLLLYKLSPDKYPVSFIHAGIKNQLQFKFRENIQIKYSPILINEKDDEGITSYDKFEIELLRIDEGKVILSEVNKEFMKEKIKQKYNITVSQEEILANKNLKLDKLKVNLTFLYFSKYFGSFDNYHLNKLELIELILIFRKILLAKNYPLLAELLISNLIVEKRKVTINNKDLLFKLKNTNYFQLIYTKYSQILSKLISKKNDLDPITKIISSIYFNKWDNIDNSDIGKKKIIIELLKFLNE